MNKANTTSIDTISMEARGCFAQPQRHPPCDSMSTVTSIPRSPCGANYIAVPCDHGLHDSVNLMWSDVRIERQRH
jgi:hypothetical protein